MVFKGFYNMMLGDFELFNEALGEDVIGSTISNYAWIIFVISTLLIVIILLNLLIAFISDSYEEIVNK